MYCLTDCSERLVAHCSAMFAAILAVAQGEMKEADLSAWLQEQTEQYPSRF